MLDQIKPYQARLASNPRSAKPLIFLYPLQSFAFNLY